MKKIQARAVRQLQKKVAEFAYRRQVRSNQRTISWVVGPDDIANLIPNITSVIPNSFSVSLSKHSFYQTPYDYEGAFRFRWWAAQMLAEAYAFGRLAASANGFIYLGAGGFLRAQNDAREFEFRFLKRRGIGVCCFFTGSDIRSIRVMAALEVKLGLPNIATYMPAINSDFASDEYDAARKRLAETADKYADPIFNARIDQASYLTRETLPFIYFHPNDDLFDLSQKFENPNRLIVVHAPSSPIIKGTQLVRAAVSALQSEGFDFEYVELSNVPHSRVKHELRRAHIVLNEFYSFMPGVLGVEAMAAGAILLTSADETIETDLPKGSNSAWVVTPHHKVIEHLRETIASSPQNLCIQAEAGQRWVRENATAEVSGRILRSALDAALARLPDTISGK
jgi:hypothetical protein